MKNTEVVGVVAVVAVRGVHVEDARNVAWATPLDGHHLLSHLCTLQSNGNRRNTFRRGAEGSGGIGEGGAQEGLWTHRKERLLRARLEDGGLVAWAAAMKRRDPGGW